MVHKFESWIIEKRRLPNCAREGGIVGRKGPGHLQSKQHRSRGISKIWNILACLSSSRSTMSQRAAFDLVSSNSCRRHAMEKCCARIHREADHGISYTFNFDRSQSRSSHIPLGSNCPNGLEAVLRCGICQCRHLAPDDHRFSSPGTSSCRRKRAVNPNAPFTLFFQ